MEEGPSVARPGPSSKKEGGGRREEESTQEVEETSTRRAILTIDGPRFPASPAFRPSLSPTVPPRARLRRRHDVDPAALAVGAQARHRRSHRRRDAAEARPVRGAAARHRLRRRDLPFPDATNSDWRLARHRVRRQERVLRAAAADAAGVLPGAPDRRPDVSRDQRPQRGANDDRARDHVLREHDPRVHRRDRADGVDRREDDADRAGAFAVRVDRGPLFRQRDPHAVRGHPGSARRSERGRSRGAGRCPGRSRLHAGDARDRAISCRQRGVRSPQPRADPPPGALLPEHDALSRVRVAAGAVVREPAR